MARTGPQRQHGGAARSVVAAVLIGCLVLGMVVLGTRDASSTNLRVADKNNAPALSLENHAFEAPAAPLLAVEPIEASPSDPLVSRRLTEALNIDVGTAIGEWGPNDEAVEDWDDLVQAGALEVDDGTSRAWQKLFGLRAVRDLQVEEDELSFEFSFEM